MLDEMVAWQSPVAGAGPSDRLPIHRSESPTGYSSAGCSPAEPASASLDADLYVFTSSCRNPAAAHLSPNFRVSHKGCSPRACSPCEEDGDPV